MLHKDVFNGVNSVVLDFTDAAIAESDFTNASLAGAIFRNAILFENVFEGALLEGNILCLCFKLLPIILNSIQLLNNSYILFISCDIDQIAATYRLSEISNVSAIYTLCSLGHLLNFLSN